MADAGISEAANKLQDLKVTEGAAPADKPAKSPKAAKKAKKGGDMQLKLSPEPEFIHHRVQMFDELKAEYDAFVAAQPRVPIKLSLPDGRDMDGTAWETTPMDIAKSISKSLSERVVISQVDGVSWDLLRPLEQSCKLALLDFDDDEGKRVFWHSSAHVLGEASELHFGCHLCIGPPIEEGFFYEMALPEMANVEETSHEPLVKLAKAAIAEKQPFVRLVVSKENLLKMFKHNKYKQHIINDKIPDGTSTTVYRCGPLIDLCAGPHIPHTGKIKAFAVTKNSASYFLGNQENDSLQRIYGISFPEAKMMKEWQQFMEDAAKRDHRRIGTEQDLFFFHELSPGSCFFFPNGTKIYNKLMDLQKSEYRKRGFSEVITPNMYNTKLWDVSGHNINYAENMFGFEASKPVIIGNCPGHCLMFKQRDRSYRELPIRFADFGVLHRNEASGALTGLTRVRRFQQDDAHIFCTLAQLEGEMKGCLDFLQHIYGIFGFTFHLKLSTRPDKFLGEIETWDRVEKILADALNAFGHKWELNPGDGAFYGPKIDIVVSDALRRKFQCATIQLDAQLPERFELQYRTDSPENPYARPIIIHRAILGSIERMMAILAENYAGKWPFWLSPFQALVIPVAAPHFEYAEQVRQQLHDAGIDATVDLSDLTLNKKIRNGEIAHYNFIMVVGSDEAETQTVNLRNRDDVGSKGKGQVRPLTIVIEKLLALLASKSLTQDIQFE
ncbi:hypothetical protein CXG81DRAFT_30223 [Caulochytrium protostelioides]|uniref:Probable threonine--tRNA ligase, cytoplasmic n=1 Tax=Caulochytrium protostelioides TaxID=1555241 RepID=A0A4P9WXA8_9FUNG|nr:threonyl-tRNA synthetase [Caulochytrium protostelioides]RKO99364.1 hypothetical protein CXG81DRAFT_30223 [Caulochytrium protostelioides]|eukprot:RKO99364.1 hypothetical protein CXG81DRAFT_30223 [Caulochytrium protostelioides]